MIGGRLLPNSVKRVYSILSKNDLDLLVLSVAMYYATSVHNKRYTSARDVFLELFSNVGTLSFSISPTKAWMPEILENYIGTGWVHFAAIFEFLAGPKAIDVMFTGWPPHSFIRKKPLDTQFLSGVDQLEKNGSCAARCLFKA